MARRKVTITVEQEMVDEARRLSGIQSVSGVIDEALDRLIRAEGRRRDVAAYTRNPGEGDEAALAAVAPSWDDLADNTDWEALYADTD
jgi:hypothetical protein